MRSRRITYLFAVAFFALMLIWMQSIFLEDRGPTKDISQQQNDFTKDLEQPPKDTTPIKPSITTGDQKEVKEEPKKEIEEEYKNPKERRIVVGIPTILRDNGTVYLEKTLDSLLIRMSPQQKKTHKIILFNAESDVDHFTTLNEKIMSRYGDEVRSGIIDLISLDTPLKSTYNRFPSIDPKSPQSINQYIRSSVEDPCSLKRNYGDSLIRVLWRSKQALDCAFLMDYAQPHGDLYFHLEDDTPAKREWIEEILQWSSEFEARLPPQDKNWGLFRFYNVDHHPDGAPLQTDKMGGNIGILMRSSVLPPLVTYIYENFDVSPIDWLISEYFVKVDQKMYFHSPSLVDHIGTKSTKQKVINWEKSSGTVHQTDHMHVEKYKPESWKDCDRLLEAKS